MKKKLIKKVLVWSTSIIALLVVVLVIHIYIVTQPKAPGANTIEMARIDIKQPLTQDDANKIAVWLYQQKGIGHVLVNPQTDIAVFTFYPTKNSANQIVSDFKANFNYKADRFMPTEAELDASCPAGSSSTFKVFKFFKHLF